MAEVGLVRFARVALQVTGAVLPRYRSKFSKHLFTQPQLLAVLCLMRYEDWTFRAAEVRLAEHIELRQALKLTQVPDHTTLYRFLRRLDEALFAQALAETARRVPSQSAKTTLAVDATGLAPGAISTFFVRRLHHHSGQPRPWKKWLKWLIAVATERQLVLAQQARSGPYNDSANLRPLVDAAHTVTALQPVLADAEFDSELNHQHSRALGALSVIPAKRGKRHWRIKGGRAEMRASFPSKIYCQRALVETVFSVVKRKLSARAPGRSLQAQRLQALLLGLSYNLYRLKPLKSVYPKRMSTEPSSA